MVATILLLGLLVVAAATDLRRRRIYNWTTYPGILAGWGLNAAGSATVAAGYADPEWLRDLGWIGLGESLEGFLICGAVLLACYLFREVGGGDVKLVAMQGAFLGIERGIEAMLWTFVIGGCAGLIILIWRLGVVRLVAGVSRQIFWILRLGRFSPLSDEERAELKMPLFLAPSALAAVVIVQFSLVEMF